MYYSFKEKQTNQWATVIDLGVQRKVAAARVDFEMSSIKFNIGQLILINPLMVNT